MFAQQKPPAGASLTAGHPLARDLVGAWLFNEGAGAAICDSSGYQNHGAASAPVWGADAYGNPALEMNNGPYVTFPANPMAYLIGAPGVTAVLRFRQMAISYSGRIWEAAINAASQGFALQVSNNKFLIKAKPASTETQRTWTSDATFTSTSTWYNLVMQVDAANDACLMWVDNVSQTGTGTTTFTVTAFSGEQGNNIVAGASNAFTAPGKIAMGHIYLYRRLLTAAEIASLYLDPYQMYRRRGVFTLTDV